MTPTSGKCLPPPMYLLGQTGCTGIGEAISPAVRGQKPGGAAGAEGAALRHPAHFLPIEELMLVFQLQGQLLLTS